MKYGEYKDTQLKYIAQIPSHWEIKRNRAIISEDKKVSRDGHGTLLSLSQYSGITIKTDSDTQGMFRAESLVGYRVVEPKSIVMNIMLAWNGSTACSKCHGLISPAYAVFNVTDNAVNPEYLHYFFRLPETCGYFKAYSTGIIESRLRLYPQIFMQLYSILPSREEQDQIVRYLDWQISKINRIINNKRKELTLVREYLDSEFRNVVTGDCNLIKLKRLVTLEQDFILPESDALYRKAGMYNRGRGIFLRDECPGNELGDSKFQAIHAGRLMLSGQFAWEDAVYITEAKDEAGIVSHRYYNLKPFDSVPVEYLFAYFISDEGILRLNQCSHGSAGRNRPLNINEVLNLYIPVPKDPLQFEKIKTAVRDYMKMQLLQKDKEALLNEYRTRLISDVVTGQMDVRGIEIPDYTSEEDTEENEPDEESMNEEVDTDAE